MRRKKNKQIRYTKAEYSNEYLQSPHWKQLSAKILARDPICKVCECKPSCDPHHLTYDRLGRENEFDLVGVCRGCHNRIHKMMKAFKLPYGVPLKRIKSLLHKFDKRPTKQSSKRSNKTITFDEKLVNIFSELDLETVLEVARFFGVAAHLWKNSLLGAKLSASDFEKLINIIKKTRNKNYSFLNPTNATRSEWLNVVGKLKNWLKNFKRGN